MGQTQRRGLAVKRIDLRRDDGQAIAEFAIVAPVFILFIAGLLAFGRIFFYWIDSNHLANETARWAAVDQNPYAPTGASPPGAGGETLQQHVIDSGTLEFSDASVCISFENTPPSEGEYVTVKVQKPVYTLTRFLPFSKITVRATSTMRIENFQDLSGPQAYSTTQNIGTCT
jgi:Flp pilus assembly protein TadG